MAGICRRACISTTRAATATGTNIPAATTTKASTAPTNANSRRTSSAPNNSGASSIPRIGLTVFRQASTTATTATRAIRISATIIG